MTTPIPERDPDTTASTDQEPSLRDELKTISDSQRPDQDEALLDHDEALEVGEAGHDERSMAAYDRQAGALKEKYLKLYNQAVEDRRNASTREERENAGLLVRAILRELAPQLHKLSRQYPEGIKEDYRSGSGPVIDADAQDFLNGVGRFVRPTESEGEYHDDLAERREYWASKLHRNPKTGVTVDKIIKAEGWLRAEEDRLNRQREDLIKLREAAEKGEFGLDEIQSEFVGYFGRPRSEEEMSPVQQEWQQLSHNDETTIGQLREYLFSQMANAMEEFAGRLDGYKQELADIAGE